MNAIEEIDMMVKSAGKSYAEIYSAYSKMTPEQRKADLDAHRKALGPAQLDFDKMPAEDPELKKLFTNTRPMSEGERFQAQEARRRQINRSRQQALGRQGAPAGRSIGSGYTGNEMRHGGIYATNPSDAPVGPRWQGDYRNLKSTQMMKKWMDAGNPASGGGVNSHKWKDYVANSKQDAASYMPNNPYQYTYSGSQPRTDRMSTIAPSQRKVTGSSEFGSGFNANGARGTWLNNGRVDGSTAPSQNALPAIATSRTNNAKQAPSAPVTPPVAKATIAPPPAPTPTILQVQNPNMYEDVGMDEQNIADDNWSRFVPNHLAQQPQTNPSISEGLDTVKGIFSK